MDERLKKAFDFAGDSVKLLISLSTGIITLSITFSKDVAAGHSTSSRHLLFASWIVFVVSIAFGILTGMSLTANLQPKQGPADRWPAPTIWATNVVLFSILQILAFLAATVLVIIHAIVSF